MQYKGSEDQFECHPDEQKFGTMDYPYSFKAKEDGWSQAFSLCREKDQPIVIHIDGSERGLWKIFPSGRAKILDAAMREAETES